MTYQFCYIYHIVAVELTYQFCHIPYCSCRVDLSVLSHIPYCSCTVDLSVLSHIPYCSCRVDLSVLSHIPYCSCRVDLSVLLHIPYRRKFGGLAPNECKTILAKLKFGGGASHHHEHCVHVYMEALPSSRLKYLNKVVSLKFYKKYNWQHTGAEVAICTAHEGVGPRVLLHALCHYMLWVKIFADFNLAVSTLTAKPPNLIPRQIFRLYGRYCRLHHDFIFAVTALCHNISNITCKSTQGSAPSCISSGDRLAIATRLHKFYITCYLGNI